MEETPHETDSEAESGSQWHRACALFKSVHIRKPRRRHLWEPVVFLFRSVPGPAANTLAEQIARAKEEEYPVLGGDIVRWVFCEFENIQTLMDDPTEQGAEVYWTFFERVDAIQNPKRRAGNKLEQLKGGRLGEYGIRIKQLVCSLWRPAPCTCTCRSTQSGDSFRPASPAHRRFDLPAAPSGRCSRAG